LQVLDDGRLTDSKGRVVNFKNTVIVMTSNIGSEFIDKMQSMGFGTGDVSQDAEYAHTKAKVIEHLKDYFRPEFINRLDEIISFDILSPEVVRNIVDVQIKRIGERLEQKEISLIVSSDALDKLAKEGYNPQFGARPLRRLIQEKILNPVANAMIKERLLTGATVTVVLKNDELSVKVEKKKGQLKTKRTKA
jgi:ATP-dependent Clp protease ATP-binding subunit ClpC